MFRFLSLILLAASWGLVAAHTVITYPGWRGDNLLNNGTVEGDDHQPPPGSLGINYVNGTPTFPYGMQWMYPCGGMPMSANRTKWPIGGGGVAIQPGWFSGHQYAFFYINLGIGNEPINYSLPMVQAFQLQGPNNNNYSGEFCFPQVGLPATYTPKIGDNATIQVIETAQHGAALYNCVDITFTDPSEVAEINDTNCRNHSDEGHIAFNLIYGTADLNAAPAVRIPALPYLVSTLLALALTSIWL